MKISVREVVKTLKIDVENGDFENLNFKVLIYKSDDEKYSVDILRCDSFKMNPSFGVINEADEDLYVFDSFFEIVDKKFDTVQNLERCLITEISERLIVLK